MAILRRWREDFIGKRGTVMFDALVSNGEISKLTGGAWNGVHYYASKWYLKKSVPGEKAVIADDPFAYGFSITSMEHDKSTSYPKVTTIVFDEFLTRSAYVPDEFVLFMNTISTIVRHRTDVTIFMLGNTVNRYCPYFKEMGLTHIKEMKPGDIDVYRYGDSELKVAVEYTKPNKQGKESDLYFAFDNPKLSMITSGEWELEIYPHLPYKYKPKDVMFHYYIHYSDIWLHAEIVSLEFCTFTYIHRKTTPLTEHDKNTVKIYSDEITALPNWKRRINEPRTRGEKLVYEYFIIDRVFYADNEVGEIVRNYLQWCNT
jgi:hypothetical protein